jgi:hypothetical protein
MNEVTDRSRQRLSNVKRNVKLISKRSATPAIIPKADISTITKHPHRIISNDRKLLFDTAPYG